LTGGQNCGVPFSLFSKKGTHQYKSKKTGKTTWENGVIKETRDYMENFEYKDDKIERIQHSEGVITQRPLRSGESTEFVGLGGLVWQCEYTPLVRGLRQIIYFTPDCQERAAREQLCCDTYYSLRLRRATTAVQLFTSSWAFWSFILRGPCLVVFAKEIRNNEANRLIIGFFY
jgi:hypothetical protein